MCEVVCFIHVCAWSVLVVFGCFLFQAEDGIRDLVRSRGLGDVYKRQVKSCLVGASIPGSGGGVVPPAAAARPPGAAAGMELSLIHI